MHRHQEWAQKPPEERIAGRLQFWVLGRRAKRHEPPAAELAARRAALLAEPAAGYGAGMPTVLRLDGYRCFCSSNEATELPHGHVESAGTSATCWRRPVALARSAGDDARELRGLVEAHRDALERAWHDFRRP